MRCKNCDYPLWNLPVRQCPECGTPFRPSEFTFIPNAVRFQCPHCMQAYYGTDANGHLVPREFDCGRCGAHVDMDEMIVIPAEGVAEEAATRMEFPWIERKGKGFFGAWFATIGMALVKPAKAMQALPRDANRLSAWWFLIVTNLTAYVIGFVPYMLMFLIMGLPAARAGGGGRGGFGAMFAGILAVQFVVGFIAMLVFVVIWGALAHLVLLVTGKREGSIGRTYDAICYAAGANALAAIPCVGSSIASVWWVVSAAIMLKERQKVGGGRATIAVLLLPFLVICVYVALIVISMSMAVSASSAAAASRRGMPPWSAQQQVDASAYVIRVSQALQTYHAANGQWPTHALSLVTGNTLTPADLVLPSSQTDPANVAIGGTTLEDYPLLPATKASAALQLATTQTAGMPAHRVADFVFTYAKIDPDKDDPNLWLAIASPNLLFNAGPGNAGTSPPASLPQFVVHADFTVHPVISMQQELVAQNSLRAKFGLPPLPPPETVR